MNVASGSSFAALSNLNTARAAASTAVPKPRAESECASCKDLVSIGEELPSNEKEGLIRSMVRQAPNPESVCSVVEALSAYPLEALKRVHDFGTKLEVYDFAGGDTVPDYLPTLSHPQTLGAYNTVANVLGVDKSDLTPFVLLHEFAHALDNSMGNVSELPEWKGAHKLAQFTNQAIRPYAKQDPSEYLAENTAAFLISDDALVPLIENGFAKELGVNGMEEREYWQMNQNFCKGRLERIDPEGFHMVDTMLHSVAQQPATAAKPAMSAAEWATWKAANVLS